MLILNAFMPCPAQLSAFLRQDRSLACVRSRPSFLSIRTTIKEAVCFILESHNWHLHIGSWNRGSSQRSQGIWQSEQFSHREQVFLLCTPPCSFWHCEITILLEARGESECGNGLTENLISVHPVLCEEKQLYECSFEQFQKPY